MGADRMTPHPYQEQRFELKYRIRPHQAPALRAFIGAYLELDDFSACRAERRYPVHSLYLDSADRRLMRASHQGDRNRFKLRVRYYDDNPTHPAFFEIKSRKGACILKQRAAVHRDCVSGVLAGLWPSSDFLLAASPDQVNALYGFHMLMTQHSAAPCAHVLYQREAWLDPENQAVRVTLDSEVRYRSTRSMALSTEPDGSHAVFPGELILELKFSELHPNWFRELVQCFDLVELGAAKYVQGSLLRTLSGTHLSPDGLETVPQSFV